MCTLRNLKLFTFSPVDVNGGVLPLLSSEVHNQRRHFVDIEGEVIFLAPLCQGPHFLPVDCLVVVGNQGLPLVLSANLMIELETYLATPSWVNGVQEGAEHAPLRGPSVEDQRCGGVVAYFHHLGSENRKSRTQLHSAGFRPTAPSLMMSLEGTMVLKAEL